ncbi:DMT family transporter [Tropicimonas sediminicola]|uniref:S-adenosylmethionine uptake transporter n=1 Tax=Tropicimonas sediminicola TaxID=1031541 RepID=A0A239C956_9RHOB|nr:DMT family transporter [Tropicimonas sediminicola]SNS16757.1 S-adenosylmethionine uptake transporter [Tropicimonas sediminicola]
MNENTRGILFMVLAMATMLTSDTVVKSLAQEMPLFQVIFIRHIFMTIGLVALALRDGAFRARPSPRETRLITLRTLGECGIVCFYMIALTMMPLGTGTAIFQLQPLAVTLAAAVFLAQPIGPRRLIAIATGFAGVLLIARPGSEAVGPGAVFVLLAVACICVRDIVTRKLGASVPASLLASLGSAALLVLSGAILLIQGNWAPVTPTQLGLIFAGACFLLVGFLAMVLAMRFGEIAVISPFRYVSLVFGLVYGFLFFGEVPQPIMLLGALIIVASGLYTFMRERSVNAR